VGKPLFVKPITDQTEKANDAGESADVVKPPGLIRRRCQRWGLCLIGFVALVLTALWVAREPIAAKIETIVIRDLNQRGVYPHYAARSWLPWRGLRFERVVVFRDAGGTQPVIEISAFAVDFPWFAILRERGLVTRWRTRDATITVHDPGGVLAFQHFTTKVLTRGGGLEAKLLQFRYEALSFTGSGKIIFPAVAPPSDGAVFSIDLSWFRDAVAAIGVKPETGPLFVRGTFSVNFSEPQFHWQTALEGNGKDLVSHGLPLRSAMLSAQLSDANLKLESTLQFSQGSAKLTASRQDWDHAPMVVAGQITDARGAADEVAASFDFAAPSVTISSLRGKAELLAFLHNFPFLDPFLPAGVRVVTAPNIEVKDLVWTGGGNAPGISSGSVQLQSPADILFTVGGEALSISHLQGEASVLEKAWQIKASTGRLAYRGVIVPSGAWEGNLAWPKAKVSSRLTLPKGSCDLTLSTDDWARAPFTFSGSVSDAAGRTDRISGRFDRERRSVKINQLAGQANLVEFAGNFPRVTAALPKHLEIRTFPELAVRELSYELDKKSENWSVESIQLRSGADLTADVNGRPLVMNQLMGAGSFNGRAWRLSEVNGDAMGGHVAVTGVLEGGVLRDSTISAVDLQMKQLHAWFNDSEAALDSAILFLNYRGAVGREPGQLTGAGTLRLENAPFVKVPLLDQTYALFSAFTPGMKRGDVGRLEATVSASKGVISVSRLSAEGGAVSVSATGTVDLVQRKVSGHATGNLRGVVGLATSPISQVLEMEVSGPLDQIRVRPVGAVGLVSRGVSGAAKVTGDALREGVMLPLKVLDWFRSGPAATPRPKP
jgi:hypothetical protein